MIHLTAAVQETVAWKEIYFSSNDLLILIKTVRHPKNWVPYLLISQYEIFEVTSALSPNSGTLVGQHC